MNPAVKASFAALIFIAAAPSSGDSMTAKCAKESVVQDQQTFDESRSVILERDAARELVEKCGGATDPVNIIDSTLRENLKRETLYL